MNQRIEKQVELKAPVSKVWQALTDHRQFSEWFRVRLDGPFVLGQLSTGNMTIPGYEHIKWHATIRAMEPETYFAYAWHPYAVDPKVDYTTETPTLVEFRLQAVPGGTRLTIVESGFEKVPEHRRAEAHRMNTAGWNGQAKNLEKYLG